MKNDKTQGGNTSKENGSDRTPTTSTVSALDSESPTVSYDLLPDMTYSMAGVPVGSPAWHARSGWNSAVLYLGLGAATAQTSQAAASDKLRNAALDEGLEMAARHLDKQRQAVDQDHAYQESDTGAWVFDRPETEEYSNTLAELADEIRALKRTTSGKGEAA